MPKPNQKTILECSKFVFDPQPITPTVILPVYAEDRSLEFLRKIAAEICDRGCRNCNNGNARFVAVKTADGTVPVTYHHGNYARA